MACFESKKNQTREKHQTHYVSRIFKYSIVLTLTSLVGAACSVRGLISNSNGSSPKDAPPVSLDVSLEEVSPKGCLNLQILRQKLSEFPAQAGFREYTNSFDLNPRSIDGKRLERYRNMAAESAFAQLIYNQFAPEEFAKTYRMVTQTDCKSLEFINSTGDGLQSTKFIIIPPISRTTLNIKSMDGSTEIRFALISPRQLEEKKMTPIIDRCPDFMRSMATISRQLEWDDAEKLTVAPALLSTDFLKKIAIAVIELPNRINHQLITSKQLAIEIDPRDLNELKSAKLDPITSRCPYDVTPPAGDEPPPPHDVRLGGPHGLRF